MNLGKWTRCLAVDVAILGGLYLWQVDGIENAKNVVLVIGWVIAVIGVIGGMAAKKGDLPQTHGVFKAYTVVSSAAIVVALAWCGLIALAVTYLIGWLLVEASRVPAKVKA